MCQKYSWIEKDGDVIFLTADDVFKTRRGKQLQKHTLQIDWHSHGAIRWYYNFKGGQERECTDFSTPENFPAPLVKAIKAGTMWGFGIDRSMFCMLLQQALAEYEKIKQPAWAEYKKIEQPALAEYKKIEQQAWAEYEKIKQQAWAEYEKTKQQAWA